MKASVQYNDYVGTSAADISDFKNLRDILEEWGVETERFNPVGIEFYSGENDLFLFSILCEDKESGLDTIVKVSYDKEPGYTAQDVLRMFKRFKVIITRQDLQNSKLEDEPVLRIEG